MKSCCWLWLVAALLPAGCGQSPSEAPAAQKPSEAAMAAAPAPPPNPARPSAPAPAAPAKADAKEPPAKPLAAGTGKATTAVLASGPGDVGRPMRPVKGPCADNSRCHVCHLNFSDERLAVSHALVNISCEKCHGASDAHCSDEGNVTPPSFMITQAEVEPFCKTCHPDDRPTENGVCMVVVLDTDERKYCTDCHGAHRMAQRTVRWDKKTREVRPAKAAAETGTTPEAQAAAPPKTGA